MISRLHLISGLPRSGSTLLCALLRQNPRFSAAMTSPVAMLCGAVHGKMCGGEFSTFFDDDRRTNILRGIFDSYYPGVTDDQVVFDTNRTWTGRASLLAALYPQARIICCVREIGWIIDSVEAMLAKNPLQLSRMFNFQPGSSVYARAEFLMETERGLIGHPWSTLREAWFGVEAKRLTLVSYDRLVREPEKILRSLYREIGEPWFDHDFENVVYDEPDYDAHLGMPGLHKVRSKVEYQSRKPCIPPDLFAKYAGTSFWEKPELNTRQVTLL
ncbi:sulfotransferase [Burkholderia sp. Bmkn7]|uniref:sulfotransferase family protein n=1 Tax=Burkholderia TaxID=32008 RepID=UPI00214877FB|nr:sulfotransferase [Burkholderia cepacia]